ncbi:hypothetical protein F4824DRAFT_436146 [Ustulina deusta]|nr:hypothetical protein F4824DRAFT_436146 [Ustulina deusta]
MASIISSLNATSQNLSPDPACQEQYVLFVGSSRIGCSFYRSLSCEKHVPARSETEGKVGDEHNQNTLLVGSPWAGRTRSTIPACSHTRWMEESEPSPRHPSRLYTTLETKRLSPRSRPPNYKHHGMPQSNAPSSTPRRLRYDIKNPAPAHGSEIISCKQCYRTSRVVVNMVVSRRDSCRSWVSTSDLGPGFLGATRDILGRAWGGTHTHNLRIHYLLSSLQMGVRSSIKLLYAFGSFYLWLAYSSQDDSKCPSRLG